jgi:DNA-binding MarR family transcriptional regulator
VPDQDVPDQDVPDQDGVDRILRQWQRERPDLDTSPMGVIGRVSRLSRQLEQRLDPVFARHGLEQGLFDVLATLRRSGEPYRMRPADLATSVMLTSSGITKRLDRLEASGLVVRHPDPQDRRGLLIELTPAGRELVDTALADHVAAEHQLLAALTPDDRNRLAGLLRILLLGLPATASPDGEPGPGGPGGEPRRDRDPSPHVEPE